MSRPTGVARSSIRVAAVLVLASLAAVLIGCGDDSSPPSGERTDAPRKLTFMAGFKPQANLPFVGAYVAKEKGFFEELGVDVDIRHAQSGEHLQLLLAGEVQVATANAANVIQRVADGLPIVAIALIGQKSEQGFAVGANSGINSVKDWAGKRLGYKGTVPVEFLAIAKANGLDPDKVDQVKVGFDPRVLSEGQVDILAVFVSNEPGQLQRIGYPVKVFDPSDYNIPALGLTYIASREGIEKDPVAIERFLRGALRGIEYASTHVEEAVDIVMKYAPQENRDQQRYMLTTELARARTDLTEQHGFGWQTLEQWAALADALKEFGVVTKPVDPAQMFTTKFLERIYAKRN
ncbi:MAG TPA: ABC transporter substrate-binding protein [Dehalococcoidia bacterium]|nr:ABC transporter substrate-binding protein [Dehalococcoidia bacterium]